MRQQELSELEQASSELRKALERARLRTERGPASRILPSHYDDLLKAVRFIETSLQTLCDAHDGDSRETLKDLVAERKGLRGWETWARIVTEQLTAEKITGEQTASTLDQVKPQELASERPIPTMVHTTSNPVVSEGRRNQELTLSNKSSSSAPEHIISAPPAESLTIQLSRNAGALNGTKSPEAGTTQGQQEAGNENLRAIQGG